MIKDSKLQEIIRWKPHKGQEEVIRSNSRDIAICAGRRWGKSAVVAYLVLKTFLEGLDDIKAGKKDSVKIWIVAPTYELSLKVFDYVVKWFLKVDPNQHKAIGMKPFPHIKLAEGVWIQGKSAETPHSLLGEELDFRVMDECSRIPRKVEETYLFPTTASRKGRTIYISTPFGRNWFYEKHQQLKEIKGAFQFESRDNPYLPEGEWERAKRLLPTRVFEQEYMASFLPDAAAVFRGIDEITEDCLEDSRKGDFYVMGVDLGKYEDFSVLTIINTRTNKVVYWDRFKQIDYPFQKKRIKATAERYNNARIVVDSTGIGQPIQEDLARDGMFVDDFKFSNKSKKELVEKLSIYIEQSLVKIPQERILTDELKAFGYNLTDSGNVIYKAPSGLHDDCVMSLGLAVWGLAPGKPREQNKLKEKIKEKSQVKVRSYI